MVLEALRHVSYNLIVPSHTRICSTAKPPGNFVAPSTIPRGFRAVSCRNSPFVPSVTANIDPVCAQSHRTPLKQNSLMQQGLLDSCQRSWFSEQWIEAYICEIVKHIHEAPFLQLLFTCEDDHRKMTTQRHRVPFCDCLSADEKWMEMKRHVSETLPDAIILVDDLSCSYIQGGNAEKGLTKQGSTDEEKGHGSHLWGVLILGNTIAKSACYILKTTSNASPFGTCTHFCLTKAHSFGPSWLDQIQSSWLLKKDI